MSSTLICGITSSEEQALSGHEHFRLRRQDVPLGVLGRIPDPRDLALRDEQPYYQLAPVLCFLSPLDLYYVDKRLFKIPPEHAPAHTSASVVKYP